MGNHMKILASGFRRWMLGEQIEYFRYRLGRLAGEGIDRAGRSTLTSKKMLRLTRRFDELCLRYEAEGETFQSLRRAIENAR